MLYKKYWTIFKLQLANLTENRQLLTTFHTINIQQTISRSQAQAPQPFE